MKNKKQIELIQAKAQLEYEAIEKKLYFMKPNELSKLVGDYFVLKGWLDCLKWLMEKDNGTNEHI